MSRPGVFFLRLGHLCLAQVYLFYACVEIGLARLVRVYFFTLTLCIFLECAFLECTRFPKFKRTFNCFKTVRLSTGSDVVV